MTWHEPIAYTYEADIHCTTCAIARFGQARICPEDCETRNPGLHALNGGPDDGRVRHWFYPWVPESATDREGNPVGAIAPWDDWCADRHPTTLECGTCGALIAKCSEEGGRERVDD